MSADDPNAAQVTKTETSSDFFQAIGDKVSGLNGNITNGDTAEDDHPPVEEVESLCMNCGENVSVEP